jgi:glycosyltransferase involved in cell wall biosynthesis
MNEGLRISIVTAVRNAVDTIGDTLDSVAAQSHRRIEHVVCDGMSTDGTSELLRERSSQIHMLVREPDRGIYDALNKALIHCTGDVVGFLHADDVYASSSALAAIAKQFEDPNVVAVYGDLAYVQRDDSSRIVRYWRAGAFDRQQLKWGWMPPHPTFYMRRHWYEYYVGFDLSYTIAADYEHMLRVLSKQECDVRYVPETLVHMRLGGASNRSLGNVLRKSWQDWRAIREHQVGGLVTLAAKNLRKLPQFVRRET